MYIYIYIYIYLYLIDKYYQLTLQGLKRDRESRVVSANISSAEIAVWQTDHVIVLFPISGTSWGIIIIISSSSNKTIIIIIIIVFITIICYYQYYHHE